MELLSRFVEIAARFVPALIAALIVIGVISGLNALMRKRYADVAGARFRRQALTLFLSVVGILVFIVTLPLSDSLRGQLLSLVGIVLSAAIALSSTTFVGNAMAGIMLRAIKSCRPGDYISVGGHSGRVSEMGLLRTEIQTEDRDLTTLPNLYLVTTPMKVVERGGTIISAEVSIGYDVPRGRVQEALLAAAEAAELEDGFVLVRELGDFSVVYRVAGLLSDVSSLISARSRLREMMLDKLHGAEIEILSPNFISSRVYTPETSFIPPELAELPPVEAETAAPEALVFDKAEEAASIDKLHQDLEYLLEEMRSLEEAEKKAESEEQIGRIEASRAHLAQQKEGLETAIKAAEENRE